MFIYIEWFKTNHLLTCKEEESFIICQLFVPVINTRDSCKDLLLYSSLAVPKDELESAPDKPEWVTAGKSVS